MKNDVFALRSSISIRSAAIRTGDASTIRIEVESTPQTKIGRRPHVSPGARKVRIVARRFRPFRQSEIPISMNAQM
jgi:hypothetical protein